MLLRLLFTEVSTKGTFTRHACKTQLRSSSSSLEGLSAVYREGMYRKLYVPYHSLWCLAEESM